MPSEAIAQTSAMRAYKTLFSARAVVGLHQLKHLGGIFDWAFWLDARSRGRYSLKEHIDTVGKILTTLERVYTLHPVALGEVIIGTSMRASGEQMHLIWLMQNAAEATTAKSPEARFQPLLSAVQDMAESLHPLLMAPLVAARSLSDRGIITNGLIDPQSGRATPTGLDSQPLCGKLMPVHLDRKVAKHIRNSSAHRRWRALSANAVEINDFNAAGLRTFGPKNYDHAQMLDFVDEWGIKLAACFAALCIFDINNHESLVTRCAIPLPTEPVREDIEQQLLETLVSTTGLILLERVRVDADLELKVGLPKPRQATPEEVRWGGDGWIEKQVITPHVREVQLDEAVRGVIEESLTIALSYETLRIKVHASDGTSLGTVSVSKADRVAYARRQTDHIAVPTGLPLAVVQVVTMVPGPVQRFRRRGGQPQF